MRYLSLSLPFLATDRLVRLGAFPLPGGRGEKTPCATFTKVKTALRLAAVDPCAQALGLEPGQTLADAKARHPALIAIESDPLAEAKTLIDIMDWCRRFTPLTALDAPDGVMLDVTGAVHLFGGEEKCLHDIETRLQAQGFAARAALASTPEAAWALSHYGKMRLLPESFDERSLIRHLGPLPLAALRLDAELVKALARAGLRRVSDIILRPRAPLAARFGTHLFERLDALLGRAKNPISPRFEAPLYVAERRYAEGIVSDPDIEATLFSLAQDLCLMLTRQAEGARHIEASFFRVDGAVKHLEVRTSRALRDPAAIARLFHERLEAIGEGGLEANYGFDVLRLAAISVEGTAQVQVSLDDHRNETEDLADLIDRLGARLGMRRVKRLALQDHHIPDFAVAAVPAASKRRSQQGVEPILQLPHQKRALPLRPLRLLLRPEEIEAIATVPDGPPLKFRWRRVLHEVAAVEGPERIAADWWKENQTFTRDYFRAENNEGQSFWLFRDGLYRETPEPRWFMHGLFA